MAEESLTGELSQPVMPSTLHGELRVDILKSSPGACATKWVLETTPFIFREREVKELWRWKEEFAVRLDVDPKNVLITGSAAVGVSLNPSKYMKLFDQRSDIDVAVISTHHFDLAWRALRNLGTARLRLTRAQQYAVEEHVKRFIYWGTVATDKILPLLPFAEQWLSALSHIATVDPTAGREVNVRIYKDFASLRSYLSLTFRNLRDQLVGDTLAKSEKIEG